MQAEGYVALCPCAFWVALASTLTNAFLANAKFTSNFTQCFASATANENGSFPFCRVAQIGSDWAARSSVTICDRLVVIVVQWERRGSATDRKPWRRQWA